MTDVQDRLKAVYRDYDRDPAFAHFRDEGKRIVPGRGSMTPVVVIIGEAPGRQESVRRKPFVGPAGAVLDALLISIGVARSDVFITNVVKYRPTIGQISIRNRTPRPPEIDASRPYLWREIEVFDNTPVVTLGNTPLRTLFRPDGPEHKSRVSDWHGHGWYDAYRMYFSLYHPAVAVYDPDMMPILLEDMVKLKEGFGL